MESALKKSLRCLTGQACLSFELILLLIVSGMIGAKAQQPNILVIMADDLGYADLGFNGCPDIPTPNIDMLATQGVICTSAYVTHSVCSPSRAGFITGRHQQRFGHEINPLNGVVDTLPANQITIGNVLTNARYKTILVGKWHLGSNNPNLPHNRGFTDTYSLIGGGSGTSYYNVALRHNAAFVTETNYLTHAFSHQAVSYMTTNAQAGTPFFMFLSYNAPHVPMEAPQDYLDRFPDITNDLRKTHAAMVSALDDGIGEVLQSLDDLGIATNTLVILLSDNGGPTETTTALNTPLRGFKGNIFEGGVRVPFIARWPGRLPAGTNYNEMVSSMDIFATSVALAGGTMPSDRPMDGVNLMPFLLGETNGVPHEQLFFRVGGGEIWAVRDGDWKWMNNPTNPGPLLVQLAADGTGEFIDLSSNETARVAAMEAAFTAWDAQMIEPLWGAGEIIELNGAATLADNLGYRISNVTANMMAYSLTTPRYPPNTASNFTLKFKMEMLNIVGSQRNGYVVLGETNTVGSLIRAGISMDQSRLTITEMETGDSNVLALAPGQLPTGTNEYIIKFDKAANSLTLHLGTVSVSRVLSRTYGKFNYPGYAVLDASTRFSVFETSYPPPPPVSVATYEWDAGGGANRNWSTEMNWTGNTEPAHSNNAFISGGYTAVVSQSGERTAGLYVGGNSAGRVEQVGGDLVVGDSLYLGRNAGFTGSYLITNGILQVDGFLYIAGNNVTDLGPDGQYEQFGGSATVSQTIRVANSDSSTGRLVMGGGTLNARLNLQLANHINSRATMNVSGSSTVRVSGVTTLGKNVGSVASLSVSGGLFVVNGNMNVGEAVNSTGTLAVTGGSIALSNSQLCVGNQGAGSVHISGGAVTAGTVAVSFAPNGVGVLSISGGRLVATNIGESLTLRRRSAVVNVSGGTVEANGVYVGTFGSAGTPATLNLTGGNLLGGRSNGTGTSNDFFIAQAAGVTGLVNITGGLLDLSRANNDLVIGQGASSLGILTIGGGTATVAGAVQVGNLTTKGNGQIFITNGWLSVLKNLSLPITVGSTATVVQAGGMVKIGGNLTIGSENAGGAGRYVIRGGTLTNSGSLLLGHKSSGTGCFEVVGSAPSIRIGTNFTMASRGELRVTFSGSAIAPIIVSKKITVTGTLSISNAGSYALGTYLIATSVSRTAISGKFTKINWPSGVTGTVAYANNKVTMTITKVPAALKSMAPEIAPSNPPKYEVEGEPVTKPNIIVIMVDDLGYADLGFNGCPDIPTPNIDMLATQGVICTSGYVTHSVCSPSRAGFITGRYQQRFGHDNNPIDGVIDTLAANQITIGNVLTNAGYKTILVGKWHLGSNNPNLPHNRGFTDTYSLIGGGAGSSYYNVNLRHNSAFVVETNYLTHAFSHQAVSYITTNAQASQPFFMFLSYNAPHVPMDAPQDYLDRFPDITDTNRKVHAAMVSALDDGIGEVLQSLQDNGIETNTLVIFLSDNGGPTETTTALNTPLRGFKGNIFEGGVRVPFIARWPGRLPGGTNFIHPVSALDIFPTAVALAGGVMPSDRSMDGVNLMPFLLGETNGVPHEQLFFRTGGGEIWALREGDWKWMNNPTNPGPLLVQLEADGTGEFTDLSTGEVARVQAMESAFTDWEAQMIEPLWGSGEIIELNGAAVQADNLGYSINNPNKFMGYALVSPRYPPVTTSNFLVQFSMEMVPISGRSTNGYVVLSETASTNSVIRAGVSIDAKKLIITEEESGGSTEYALSPFDVPVGTNQYDLVFDKGSTSLTLRVGTVSVTRVLSRPYGTFSYPGYAMSNATVKFTVLKISHTMSESITPTYEWDADGGADRSWSNGTNWTGGVEPSSANTAYINGGFTSVVSQAGERAFNLYVGSTNQPSNGANSTGSVEQTGGDLVVGGSLTLGNYAGGNGKYFISGGSLLVSNLLNIGNQGLGTMVITNSGSVTVGSAAVIGLAGDGPDIPGSRLTVGGGSLNVNGTFLNIGGDNTAQTGADGILEQFGGTITANQIKIADNPDSTGKVVIAGGTLSVGGDLKLSENGVGLMHISGSSTTTVGGITYVSLFVPSKGTLTVSGGLFKANGSMEIGNVSGATGDVQVSGGHLTSTNIVVGRQGMGIFSMSGGSVTSSLLSLSFAPNGIGVLNVSGGQLALTNAGENLFLRRRSAVVNVSGGSVQANGILIGSVLGHNSSDKPAVLNLSGGTISGGFNNDASISNDFYIGAAPGATGVVNITGGLLDLSRSNNDLILGRGTNAMGIFTMGGGTAVVAGAVRVGALVVADPELTGNGQLYMTNGLLDIGGALQLPIAIGSTASMAQVGGVVKLGNSLNLGVSGGGGVGRFVISGGTLTNSGSLNIGHTSSGSGFFEVAGGSPSIHVSAMTVAAQGELRSTFNGASIAPVRVAGLITAGGKLSITNTGEYASGTFLIATSMNGTAVSGTFDSTNWMNGVTGTVSYANNRIAVVFDLTPQLIGVPADDVAECDDVPVPALVTATNGCGELSSVKFFETTNSGACANSYELIRVWSVTNTCGYGVSATQVLSVADTTIPDITCPADTNVNCEAEAGPSLTGYAMATDNCDISPVVSYVDAPGAGFISRTWSAMDACSNEAMCVQIITVNIGTNDYDNDGVSDYDECVAGTSAVDSNSYLKLTIDPLPPGAALSFTSLVTHAYTIEYQLDLTNNATWPVLTNITGTGDKIIIQDSAPADQRNYRIKANRDP